ncbi:receptor-transporting protein 4 [Homo sapiens]|uniref:Receptor-transporting protein 4 n=1 Tax=Homo sapiens TaxID=9606 RepID=RTP4_HUMAN|nr:receptor-transporting protein 4 [Homo sapiens]Q96DX8.3 RecName: Full=Receptor-transporting protein 4; AltName: Full=28 kDa interferon-responsive protein; AltName: Full=3CxxC-type zinc finger protein 4 [Homo sapiens]EAW78148.1 receptor transporter protein 4 [Homo sapiens]|eukprot:NP_071430.2 receptor-transporting protein 4 [Homo sapiens]
MVVDFWTWEQTFQELIQEAKPRATWTLKLDGNLQLDCLAQGWKQYQQRAFGWFRCSSCQRSWASAQVQILCHTYWEHWTSQGQVRMRLFGQRCQKCSWSQYEMPEFSSDSTMRILSNLVQHILKKYYGNGTRKSPEMPVILEVSLEGSHDTANCEACTLGICGQGLKSCMTKPSKSLLPHLKTGNSSPGIGAVYLANQAKNQSAEAKEAKGSGYEKLGPSRDPDPLNICVFILLLVFIVVKCFTSE